MSIIGWIILGLIAGWIASKIVDHKGSGIVLDIVLGVVGALVGGWIYSLFAGHGISGFNIISLVVAIGGAIVVLLVYNWVMHQVHGHHA